MSQNELPIELYTNAREFALMLNKAVTELEALSEQIPGGFAKAKILVKELTDKGMEFPLALYQISQEIIEGKHGKA